MTTGVFNYRTSEWRKIQAKVTQEGPPENPLAKVFFKFADRLPPEVLTQFQKQGQITNTQEQNTQEQRNRFKHIVQELEKIPEAQEMIQELVAQREVFNHRGLLPVEKNVANGRELVNPSFDTNGFILSPHCSAITDWTDEEQVRRIYYPEISELVKQLSGASIAVCNSHLHRRSGLTSPTAKLFNAGTGPIHTVHNDFTDEYHAAIARLFKEAEQNGYHTDVADFGAIAGFRSAGVSADTLRNSRFVVFNTWRNVGEAPLLRKPLAVVDNRTVSRWELIPGSIGGDRNRNTQGLGIYISEYNPEHQFYYMPKMTKEEVLIIKTYDSAQQPFIPTLHTAFDDPQTPADAPQRSSIDARVLCLFQQAPLAKL